MQRLFPEAEKLEDVPQNQWFAEVEKLVRNHIGALKKQQQRPVAAEPRADVVKLQAQIVTYENIIDDTVRGRVLISQFLM